MGSKRLGLPDWYVSAGAAAWLFVGIVLVMVGGVWLLSQTSTIAEPLILGAVIAAVAGQLVSWLQLHRVPRAAGAALVLLGLVLVGVVVAGLVLGGITSHGPKIDADTSKAVDKIQGWAEDLGITSAKDAAQSIKKAIPDLGHTLLTGFAHGISGITSAVVFLGFTVFITFFLLKDGPAVRAWSETHLGVRPAIARILTGDILHALRQYFLGLTLVGAFNALVVGLGALIVGVPLPGTIAVVTFVGSYVPIVGAWTAGGFAFALALASQGTTAALIMALIVFAANGPLQQVVQPIAYGATLQLNPLVVFVATIAAGSLFGMVGLVLAAPLISAGVHAQRHVAELHTAEAAAASALGEHG